MTSQPDPLDVARDLVAMGVPVFALPPGKGPKGYAAPLGWDRFTADPKRLAVHRPGYALAAVCGHVFDVIDRDPRNDPGPFPCEWPTVYGITGTPGGGEHYWIAATGLPKGKIAQGWDLQAGSPDGTGRGFVFIPGTAGYGWIQAPMAPGPSDGAVGPLVAHMAAPKATSEPSAAAGELGEPIPRGEHQATLFALACSLRARGVPEDYAEALVERRALDCVPPWAGPDTPWGAVRHAYRLYPPGEHYEPVAAAGFNVRPAAPTTPGAPPVAPTIMPQPVDWHAAFGQQKDLEWVIPGIVPVGAGVVMYSPPGLGKSLLTLEWAVRAAQAGSIVTYVDQENDLHHEVVRRLSAMGVGPDDLSNLRFYSFPEIAPLDSAAGARALLGMVEGSDLVILDTISRLVAGEENSNDTWNAYYRHAGMALKAAGIACLRLDHAGKDADKGQRGGSAKSGDVDIVWRLSGMEEGQYSLQCEKNRMPIPERWIVLRRYDEPLHHERVSASEYDAKFALKRSVWEALENAQATVDIPRDHVREILKMNRIQIGNALLGEVLKAWKDMGNVLASRPDWAPDPVAEATGCLSWGGAPPAQTASG